jgi:hypothetical protein
MVQRNIVFAALVALSVCSCWWVYGVAEEIPQWTLSDV